MNLSSLASALTALLNAAARGLAGSRAEAVEGVRRRAMQAFAADAPATRFIRPERAPCRFGGQKPDRWDVRQLDTRRDAAVLRALGKRELSRV
jgi:hypothetical protein